MGGCGSGGVSGSRGGVGSGVGAGVLVRVSCSRRLASRFWMRAVFFAARRSRQESFCSTGGVGSVDGDGSGAASVVTSVNSWSGTVGGSSGLGVTSSQSGMGSVVGVGGSVTGSKGWGSSLVVMGWNWRVVVWRCSIS